ncbi:hypothetical protein FHX42_003963 [Saccharopolyspora lacisalsi]|uniref:Uncharacterized protein n=1 Tax=Halosaccharopolyspora lacisalsi TaxID=1000566 RepID=A0A839DYM2_9PSEU|nr:hypothetical protein [Halosaccharopolyspora lacisalsi]MBA8826584.1 hypothetical protein [Halosaccharopolyspora lacisalsi]
MNYAPGWFKSSRSAGVDHANGRPSRRSAPDDTKITHQPSNTTPLDWTPKVEPGR